MTRFFYTDPLAAAWMAKHFGMEFIDPITGRIEPSDIGTALFSRGCIHPDSLPLLKPRKGDLCKVGWIAGTNSPGDDYIVIRHDNSKACVNAIVQRNGIPFMWPESEDA